MAEVDLFHWHHVCSCLTSWSPQLLEPRCTPKLNEANFGYRSQYHSRPRRYSQYLQLAISVVIDLRLDRNPDIRPWKTRLDVRNDAADHKMFLGLDEQRAVAGCYYLSCSISKLLQKRCTFPWSLHIEECCTTLYQQQQYPTVSLLESIYSTIAVADKSIGQVSPTKLNQQYFFKIFISMPRSSRSAEHEARTCLPVTSRLLTVITDISFLSWNFNTSLKKRTVGHFPGRRHSTSQHSRT